MRPHSSATATTRVEIHTMQIDLRPASMAGQRAWIRKRLRRALLWASIFFVCWALCMLATGERFLFSRIGLYAAPWLMILAGGLALAAIWQEAWRAAFALGLVCAGLTWAQWPEPRMALAEKTSNTTKISVMTLTVQSDAKDMAPVVAFLRAHPADFVAIQHIANPDVLLAQMPSLFHCRDSENLILSRFPLGPSEPESTTSQLFCKSETPLGPIMFGSVSLPFPQSGQAGRARGLARLMTAIDSADRSVVLAGSFNTVPLAQPYRQIRARLDDAFAGAGNGWGLTFPTRARSILGASGPLLRLDYVFHGRDLVAHAAHVLDKHPPYSDRWPLRAVLGRLGS